jgi:hypothetical protein
MIFGIRLQQPILKRPFLYRINGIGWRPDTKDTLPADTIDVFYSSGGVDVQQSSRPQGAGL